MLLTIWGWYLLVRGGVLLLMRRCSVVSATPASVEVETDPITKGSVFLARPVGQRLAAGVGSETGALPELHREIGGVVFS